MTFFPFLDWLAISWFLFCAIGYSWLTEHGPSSNKTLSAYMNQKRESWLRVTLMRDMRIVDATIISGLQYGTAFFASASLLAIGGCFAVLKSADEVYRLLQELPLALHDTQAQWEVKVLGLLLIYAYAFFKFGWSFRLWNYTSILMGAIPIPEEENQEKKENALQSALTMNRIAGTHFNRGLRTFFLSIGYIGWFIGPIAFIIATSWIILVLTRRQFFSQSKKAAAIGLERKQ